MKTSPLLVLVIFALSCVEATWSNEDYYSSNGLQQAVGGDMDLKLLMVEDGTPKGKCYCSCSLNNQPVFLEIDPSNLPGSFAINGGT